jgi:hypothetical protein
MSILEASCNSPGAIEAWRLAPALERLASRPRPIEAPAYWMPGVLAAGGLEACWSCLRPGVEHAWDVDAGY